MNLASPPAEPRESYSPAVWMVWKMAGQVAKRDQTLIEPFHFLSTTLLLCMQADTAHFDDPGTKGEVKEVAECLVSFNLQVSQLLKDLQAATDQHTSMTSPPSTSGKSAASRSAVSKRGFEQATLSATQEGVPQLRLRHLVGGLLMCSKELDTALGITADVATQLTAKLLHTKPALSFHDSRYSGFSE